LITRIPERAKALRREGNAKKSLGIGRIPWRPSLIFEFFAAVFVFLPVFARSPDLVAGNARAESLRAFAAKILREMAS
jgi:hypothetical protein